MRFALLIGLLLLSSCTKRPQLAQGPQPFLIVCVTFPNGQLCGTLGSDIPFDFYEQSRDGQKSLSMRASLNEKGSSGFRFRWEVVQRTNGTDSAKITEEEFAPWGRKTNLPCVPGHTVTAFYATKTANQLFTR